MDFYRVMVQKMSLYSKICAKVCKFDAFDKSREYNATIDYLKPISSKLPTPSYIVLNIFWFESVVYQNALCMTYPQRSSELETQIIYCFP